MLLDRFGCDLFLVVAFVMSRHTACKEQIAIVKTLFVDTADRINKSAKDAINSFAEGDELRVMLMGLKRFTKTDPFNVKEARQLIATKIIDANEYCY